MRILHRGFSRKDSITSYTFVRWIFYGISLSSYLIHEVYSSCCICHRNGIRVSFYVICITNDLDVALIQPD